MENQKTARLCELMRDLENTVLNGGRPASDPQGSDTARRTMKGIIPHLATNVFRTGDSGFPAGGDLDEAKINYALRRIWENSSAQVDLIVVGGFQKRKINTFCVSVRRTHLGTVDVQRYCALLQRRCIMAQKTSQSLRPRGRFWRKHVQQCQRSGATHAQYCMEHKLSVAAFRWWRRKLTHGHPVVDPQKELPTSPVPTFTEIRIPEGGAGATMYAYEIILPNRTQVRLRQNFDAEAVAALVSLLRAPC